MSTPSAVRNALAPTASVYPPLTAFHMIVLDALGCALAKIDGKETPAFTWFDIVLAHVAFSQPGKALMATVDREGREWLNKEALKVSVTLRPGELRDILPDIADHIQRGCAAAVAFDGEQKKTNADGFSPSVKHSSQNTDTPLTARSPNLSPAPSASSPPAQSATEPSQQSDTSPLTTSSPQGETDGGL